MAAFLELVASGRIDVHGLISERVRVEHAPDAYERLLSHSASPLGVVLEYSEVRPEDAAAPDARARVPASSPRVNVVGAGSFAQRVLVPNLKRAGFRLGAVASARGLTAKAAADRFGFGAVTTADEALSDPAADLVAIATRHASHAALVEAALRAGKAVFVEKPPCLTDAELHSLRTARAETGGPLFVGFNRRHAPFTFALREHVRETRAPIELLYRVNAEPLPPGHWLCDPDDGGGRLLGEGCHFIDFARWVIGADPVAVAAVAAGAPAGSLASAESFSIVLRFVDGSLATILYGAAGSRAIAKEYVEAHAGRRSATIDDYRTLALYGHRGRPTRRTAKQDKGHRAQFAALIDELASPSRPELDPLDSMQTTLEAQAAVRGEASVAHHSPNGIGAVAG
jgi:predicted dehydrogenase